MTKNLVFVIICLVWVTGLTVWVVNKFIVDVPTITVQGIPSSVQLPRFAVQMDANRVWVIDTGNDSLEVITHDQNGYHNKVVSIKPTP